MYWKMSKDLVTRTHPLLLSDFGPTMPFWAMRSNFDTFMLSLAGGGGMGGWGEVIDALESGKSCSCPHLFIFNTSNFTDNPYFFFFSFFHHRNSPSSSFKSRANKGTKSTARTKQFVLQSGHTLFIEHRSSLSMASS